MPTPSLRPDSSYRQLLERFYDQLQEVFGFRPKAIPDVFIVSSRVAYDSLMKRPSADWEIGCAKGDAVYFLEIDAIRATEAHKHFDADDLDDAVRHEAAHIYFNRLTHSADDRKMPRWLSEGLAVYWSGQQAKRQAVKSFGHLNDTDSASMKYHYGEGGTAVQLLLDEFGVDKFKNVLNRLAGTKDIGDFADAFAGVYGFLPNDEEFNRLLPPIAS